MSGIHLTTTDWCEILYSFKLNKLNSRHNVVHVNEFITCDLYTQARFKLF